jgi:ATP-binding cassette subfamily B multidrug efflux pump
MSKEMYDQDKRQYTMKDKEILKRLLSYAKPYKYIYSGVFALLGVIEFLSSYEPVLIGQIVDYIGVVSDEFKVSTLVLYMLALIAIILITSFVSYFQNVTLQKTGQSIIYDIRMKIFTFLESHDIAFLNSTPAGAWVTRVANDTNTLNEMFTSVITNVLGSIIKLVFITGFMFFINWKLALYALAIIPFVLLISVIFRMFMRVVYRESRKRLSRVNAFLAEHLSGMKIIQVFNQEENKKEQFKSLNKNLQKANLRQILLFSIYRPSMYLVYMMAVTIIFYVGRGYVLDGSITYGVLFTFYIYVQRFFEPIQNLAEQFNVLQSAFASSERIFGVLDSKKEVIDSEDAVDLESFRGSIEFKDVWFKYVEDEWVLKGVSFKVDPNQTVAFVGATGSGKSTILSLIVRNYDIQKGQILLDGKDIKSYTIASIRHHIGQMLQDVFMFSGTLKSNIDLYHPNITDGEIDQAIQYVNADRFINSLPNGINTEVRERGNNFSTGQRQLISFARTIVHKPSLLILDEATSNIDTETEQLIQLSLEKMMASSTMLVVAHRLSTIQHADNIIVLSHGKIIEQGDHQGLLKNKKHYYQLYQLQYED